MIRPRRRRFSAELEHQHEVVGLLLDLDVAVAQHPEGTVTGRAHAGKQLRQPDGDDRRLDRGKADCLARQPDEPVDLLGDHDQRANLGAVFARQLHHHDQRAVWNKREGMRRVDRDRRQHRQQPVDKTLPQPGAIGSGQRVVAEDGNSFIRKVLLQLRPAALLAVHETPGNLLDRGKLLLGRQTVIAPD